MGGWSAAIRSPSFCEVYPGFGANADGPYWVALCGCKMMFIRPESANPQELKLSPKSLNLCLEYAPVLKRSHRCGIAAPGAFVPDGAL